MSGLQDKVVGESSGAQPYSPLPSRRDAVRRWPLRPPYEGTGLCPMCGQSAADEKHRRRVWHPECAKVWLVIGGSLRGAIRLLKDRDGDRCAACAKAGDGHAYYEVDHKRPLWSLTALQRTQMRWWMPWNLQLLCHTCHLAKTRHEAGERARICGSPAVVSMRPADWAPSDDHLRDFTPWEVEA